MTKVARTVFVFGIYLYGLGATLLIAPNPFLDFFGLPPVNDIWIRALGMAFLFLATYHVVAARHEFTPLFRVSVYLRALVIAFFAGFVVLGLVKPVLILFGCFDLAGATWTAVSLRAAHTEQTVR
jgi:hypothetical protein